MFIAMALIVFFQFRYYIDLLKHHQARLSPFYMTIIIQSEVMLLHNPDSLKLRPIHPH